MSPLVFEKSAHNALWGTESWELSAFPTDPSRIAMNSLFPSFPLLFKVIDARTRLSVQVHPNEETCKVTGGDPKTEMWCAASSEGDAEPCEWQDLCNDNQESLEGKQVREVGDAEWQTRDGLKIRHADIMAGGELVFEMGAR